MTDRLLDYVNYNARKVTEKFPNKKILTLAYGSTSANPSERIGPDSNVMVMYAPLHRPEPNYDGECHSHGLDCINNLWAKEVSVRLTTYCKIQSSVRSLQKELTWTNWIFRTILTPQIRI